MTAINDKEYKSQEILNRVFNEDINALTTSASFILYEYDYVSLNINSATETYTFKVGGSGGTTTNTVVVVYTDSTRTDILTVTKT